MKRGSAREMADGAATPPTRFPDGSMSTKPRAGRKDSGTDTDSAIADMADRLAERLTQSFTVGTDAEGYDHHFYAPADTVVVYDRKTGELDDWQYLNGRPLDDWVAFVQSERGWMLKGPHARRGIKADRQRKGDGS